MSLRLRSPFKLLWVHPWSRQTGYRQNVTQRHVQVGWCPLGQHETGAHREEKGHRACVAVFYWALYQEYDNSACLSLWHEHNVEQTSSQSRLGQTNEPYGLYHGGGVRVIWKVTGEEEGTPAKTKNKWETDMFALMITLFLGTTV